MKEKAFIFDMDGVLIDTERTWMAYGNDFLVNLFGKEIADEIGDTIGMTVNTVYEKAISYGASTNYDEYLKIYDKEAAFIYSKATITGGVEQLVEKLVFLKFKLGLVSSSRRNWIDRVLPRLSFRDRLEQIISLNDRSDLKPKPNPDGYLEALKNLRANPKYSIVLEDSNSGIQAAKAAGAYVIAFRGNLVEGYEQKGADAYAGTMDDVSRLVEKFVN